MTHTERISSSAPMEFGIHQVETHVREKDLSVVYTNDPAVVEDSVNTMKQLLAQDGKYKVVGIDPQYTDGHVGYDQKVVVAELCVGHHVLVYNYSLATRPCERFARVWGSKKEKDSLVNLASAIIGCYYENMKEHANKNPAAWHGA
ncbi:uncharacterized protein [Aegilops tauschii subsp. strangulata]|uniref:uncharacterized protein n=1 Tax=Aegilops tauschii subsp. strangulata TaxID=200361 RepID=UPI003CC885F2